METERQTDGGMYGRIDEQTDTETDRQTDEGMYG
jgi:hypothetical protein